MQETKNINQKGKSDQYWIDCSIGKLEKGGWIRIRIRRVKIFKLTAHISVNWGGTTNLEKSSWIGIRNSGVKKIKLKD